MEVTSFVLGASTGVVIAIAIVAVLGYIKAIKIEQNLRTLREDLTTVFEHATRYTELDNRRIDGEVDRTNNLITDVYRTIDSRLDKLTNVIERDYITKKDKLDNSIGYNN